MLSLMMLEPLEGFTEQVRLRLKALLPDGRGAFSASSSKLFRNHDRHKEGVKYGRYEGGAGTKP
jgi:hypothetical protein